MREKCTLCENGQCHKWRKKGKCVPTTLSAFDKRLEICEVEEVCEKSSIFGNSCFFITDEDIELLKSGKVLFDIDEYGMTEKEFDEFLQDVGDTPRTPKERGVEK